jgi:hypothetical protein
MQSWQPNRGPAPPPAQARALRPPRGRSSRPVTGWTHTKVFRPKKPGPVTGPSPGLSGVLRNRRSEVRIRSGAFFI